MKFQAKIDFAPSARSVDNNGFLHVDAVPMFRSGIVEITGMELQAWVDEKLDYSKRYRLRIKQEVLDENIGTFAHKPITWGHKWIGGNTKNDFIGFTGDNPFIDGDLACDNMTIADTDAVYRINTKEREELSAGISGEIATSEVGYADYDLLSFECNHVAVVKKGKAGHRVRILNEVIGETEGSSKMSEEVKQEEVKNETKPEEKIEETVKADEKTAENVEKAPEEAPKEAQEDAESTKTEEEKPEETKASEEKDDSEKQEEGVKQEIKKEDEKPSEEKTEEKKEEVKPQVSSDEPKQEEKHEEERVWSYNITGVEHSDNPNDPSIKGTTVEINFEEGGVYEYKEGKFARIQLEDIVSGMVEKRASDMIEAFSICKQIDSGVSLDKDIDSMYRLTAKLVFGNIDDECSGESLKHMLQGYLLGRGAKLTDGYEEKKDIRTIEVNV